MRRFDNLQREIEEINLRNDQERLEQEIVERRAKKWCRIRVSKKIKKKLYGLSN